jgi:hypothetical protein
MSDDAKPPSNPFTEAINTLAANIKDPQLAAPILLGLGIDAIAFATHEIWAAIFFSTLVLIYVAGFAYVHRPSELARLGAVSMDPTHSLARLDEMTIEDRSLIGRIVAQAATEVAQLLEAPPMKVRSNLFGLDGDGKLAMATPVAHNMTRGQETELRLEVGLGSTGLAFSTGQVNIAVLKAGSWGDAEIPTAELAKIDPDLRWIISWPVLSGAPSTPMFVLNVDGLYGPPDVQKLETAAVRMATYAQMIAVAVARSVTATEEQ